MPKYELIYIVGGHTSDNQIPSVLDEVKKVIQSSGGSVEKHEEWGKKKLAYPIKHGRTGHYVLVNFSAPAEQIGKVEHYIRTSPAIIRHLIVNMEEPLHRMEKDRIAQARLKALRPKIEEKPEPVRRAAPEKGKKIQIDLDAEIEKAIESPEELK